MMSSRMTTGLEMADAELIALSLGGDRDAFGEIVARYQTLVCSLAYSACGDIHFSEELAQETFLAAWRQLRNLREPEKLKSWLCGIARNLSHNALRRQQRVPTAAAEELDDEAQSPAASPEGGCHFARRRNDALEGTRGVTEKLSRADDSVLPRR